MIAAQQLWVRVIKNLRVRSGRCRLFWVERQGRFVKLISMAELTWMRVEQTTDALAGHLLDASTLPESAGFPGSCDKEIDEWVNRFADSPFPEFSLPRDPQQRKALLARLKHASQIALQNQTNGAPSPHRLSQAELFKFLLIEQWHRYAAESNQRACAV